MRNGKPDTSQGLITALDPVVSEALPAAVHQVLNCLHFSRHKRFDHKVSLSEWVVCEGEENRPQIATDMQDLRTLPYPSVAAIHETLNLLTAVEIQHIHPRDQCSLIEHLPETKTYLFDLQKSYNCAECSRGRPTADQTRQRFKNCDRKSFFRRLAIIVADVLAISLFHDHEDMIIRNPIQQHIRNKNELRMSIEAIISNGNIKDCNFTSLLDWALALAGHDVSENVENLDWVMSC
jgi:hypothetical protein